MFNHKVNKLARLKRHSRLHIRKQKVIKEKIIFSLSAPEQNFFFRVLASGAILFVLFSVLPSFLSADADFWVPSEEIFSEEIKETIVLADEGFLIKPEIHTQKGNRENVHDIIEIAVESGDTISSIAKKYGVSVSTITQNNNIYNANQLKKGKILTILPVDGLLHKVKKGETVNSLAKKYKIDSEKIIAQNSIDIEQSLATGTQIIIPGAQKAVPAPAGLIASSAFKSSTRANAANANVGGALFFPCKGHYTQFYHYGHYAVDIAESGGSPIWAAGSGKVTKAQSGWNGGYGNMIIIDHGNGMTTLYAHLREINVNVGQSISRGQYLGYMGNTGRVYGRTGIHLHFEVIVNGTRKNPIAYF